MDTKTKITELLKNNDCINTSQYSFSSDLHGTILSLSAQKIIEYEQVTTIIYILTNEGKDIVAENTPEFKLWNSVGSSGLKMEEVDVTAKNNALRNKWIKVENGMIFKATEVVNDFLSEALNKSINEGLEMDLKSVSISNKFLLNERENNLNFEDENIKNILLKRKFIKAEKKTHYTVKRGECYDKEIIEVNEITDKYVVKNLKTDLKKLNFKSRGVVENYGALHPLMKMKTEIKNIFLEMGFEEMDTSNYVESSFWNFDALFQPQAHPARDAHDTFFVDSKAEIEVDRDYFKAVKKVHELGYLTPWVSKEANKLVMRTHTTACSARHLFELAKDFKPKKLFSIDRVFRNESVDATHLAEFHQVEGVVIDRNLNISVLMGLLEEFFKRLNIENIKFKPTYNPYTEPSLEVFAVHEKLGLLEIGNSGVFRPEMLRTMGFDVDVRAVAWGLSLERPAMIKYGLNNIRELMGHKVDVDFIRKSKIVSFDN